MRAAFAVALFVALAVAGAGVQVGSAGNTSTKYYSTSLPLTGLSAGTSLATTVTLANSTTSTQSLGSEQI
ncbi:MAG: hypothetical protein ACXVRQ_03770, partial [Gaiellaceae bacterium]